MTPSRTRLAAVALILLPMALPGPATAQAVISLEPDGHEARSGITTPPSVDSGLANGVVKPAGAPSVGDGRANGAVKQSGAPSVGNGIANGVVKSTTVNQ